MRKVIGYIWKFIGPGATLEFEFEFVRLIKDKYRNVPDIDLMGVETPEGGRAVILVLWDTDPEPTSLGLPGPTEVREDWIAA